jgi:hypothetical protein
MRAGQINCSAVMSGALQLDAFPRRSSRSPSPCDEPALFEFGTGFLPPETDAQKRRWRRYLRAETGDRRPPRARNGRKSGLSASELSVAGFGRLGGGRCSPAKPVSASLPPVIPCYLKFFRGKDSSPFAAGGCMPQIPRCIFPMISDTRGLANLRKCGLLAG